LISRPDYEGSDYNTTTAAPFGTYRWASGRFFSLGGAGGSETAARMLGDAEDSPLVESNQGVGSKDQVNAILAVLYTF